MVQVERQGKIVGGTHTIYESPKEANNASISYVHWPRVQEGEWARTDDDHVLRCLKHTRYGARDGNPNRGSDFLTFSVGRMWVRKKRPKKSFLVRPLLMNGEYTVTHHSQKRRRKVARELRVRMAVVLYCEYLLSGRPVDYAICGRVAAPTHRDPAFKFRCLLKNPHVQDMIRDQLRQALSRHGMNQDEIIGRYKTLLDEAENAKDVNTQIKVLDRFAKMLGIERGLQQVISNGAPICGLLTMPPSSEINVHTDVPQVPEKTVLVPIPELEALDRSV